MTLQPQAKLLQGLEGTALTLPMQSGVCKTLLLLTFSQASIYSHPKKTGTEFSPTSPQGSEGTHCFSPKPHIPASSSHPLLSPGPPCASIWGAGWAALPSYFIASLLLLTALPLPPTTSHSTSTHPQQHLLHPNPFQPPPFIWEEDPPSPNRKGAPRLAAGGGMGGFQVLASLTPAAAPVWELVGLGRELGSTWQGDWVFRGGLCSTTSHFVGAQPYFGSRVLSLSSAGSIQAEQGSRTKPQ